MKLLSVLMGLLLSACVGVTLHTESSNTGSSYELLQTKIAEEGAIERNITEQDVIRFLGNPVKRYTNEYGDTVLEYRADVAWRGFTLWLVLPLPLLLPVGSNMAIIKFGSDGKYRGTYVEGADSDFYGCTLAACGHLGQFRT